MKYEKEIDFYQKHQSIGNKDVYSVSQDVLNDGNAIIKLEKKMAQFENLKEKVTNSQPKHNFNNKRKESSSQKRRNESLNKNYNSGRIRSINLLNRTGNFENKRQEVLRRKEQLEHEKIERISKKNTRKRKKI